MNFWRITLIGVLSFGLAIAAASRIFWQALTHQPSFYSDAISPSDVGNANSSRGEALVDHLANAASAVRDESLWSMTLSVDEINDWLRFELPKKHPELINEQWTEPRIAVNGDTLMLGCRGPKNHIVYSAAVRLHPDGDDKLAIQWMGIWAGALPAPQKLVQNELAQALEDMGTPARWTRLEGKPTLVVSLPSNVEMDGKRFSLRSVKLTDGAIVVTGETAPVAEDTTPQPVESAAP